jgi:hypothetical protein
MPDRRKVYEREKRPAQPVESKAPDVTTPVTPCDPYLNFSSSERTRNISVFGKATDIPEPEKPLTSFASDDEKPTPSQEGDAVSRVPELPRASAALSAFMNRLESTSEPPLPAKASGALSPDEAFLELLSRTTGNAPFASTV